MLKLPGIGVLYLVSDIFFFMHIYTVFCKGPCIVTICSFASSSTSCALPPSLAGGRAFIFMTVCPVAKVVTIFFSPLPPGYIAF